MRWANSCWNHFMAEWKPNVIFRAWAVGSLTLLFLQSVTWSSGLMFLCAPSLLLAYLFSSLNTAQGLLITILHCTLARKVCVCVSLCNAAVEEVLRSFTEVKVLIPISILLHRWRFCAWTFDVLCHYNFTICMSFVHDFQFKGPVHPKIQSTYFSS